MLAALVALTHAPEPLLARRDPRAAADFVALLRRGEGATYVVQETFTRTMARGRFASTVMEARSSRFFVRRAGGSLTIVTGDNQYDCELVAGKPQCGAGPREASLPASETVAIVVALGAYDVVGTGDVVVAGERARCFRMSHAAGNEIADFGARTEYCLARDGIVLRVLVTGAQAVNEWVVEHVERTFDAATVAPLLKGFESVAPVPSR
jgi:hypothetical protein